MQTSLRPFREDTRRGRGNLDPLQFVEGILETNLDAASGAVGKNWSDTLTARTTATLNIIEWDSANNFRLTGQTQVVVNRSPQFSAGAGSYLCAYNIGGEFRPLPSFQAVRGRMLKTLTSDEAVAWPKFGLMEVLAPGRIFGLDAVQSSSSAATVTATNVSMVFVTGDVTAFATNGRTLRLANTGIDADYTVVSSIYAAPTTTITVSETLGSSTLTASSTATILGTITLSSRHGDETSIVQSGDVLRMWQDTTEYTVDAVAYSGGKTVCTIVEAVDSASADFTAELTATTIASMPDTTHITIAADIRPWVVTNHSIRLTNCGGADGDYTIFEIASTSTSSSTTITTNETMPAGTITGSSTVTILRSVRLATIHPDTRLTYAIQSVTAGTTGDVTISSPDGVLGVNDPICECDMFEEGHVVEITGSRNGENDGVFRCRKCFTDSGGLRTIYLDGAIVAATGAKGSITLQVPPPLMVTHKALAALRWYRATIQAGAIVHTLPLDGGYCHEIIAADIGPSDAPGPD